MQIEQTRWSQGKGWIPVFPGKLGTNARLVLLFGSPTCLKQTAWQDDIVRAYPNAYLIGFYSYREISPFSPAARCELHNQTMTITTLSELL